MKNEVLLIYQDALIYQATPPPRLPHSRTPMQRLFGWAVQIAHCVIIDDALILSPTFLD